MNKLDRLHSRLEKIGINITCIGNYPWIYLDTVNGQRVKERFLAEHGFTIAFLTNDVNGVKLTDTKEIFRIIRKYSTA